MVLALHQESLVVLEWTVFAKQGVVLTSDRDTLVWPAVWCSPHYYVLRQDTRETPVLVSASHKCCGALCTEYFGFNCYRHVLHDSLSKLVDVIDRD